MQYAVYITRAEHWSFEDRERQPISEAEWLAYAQCDAELRPLLALRCFDFATGKPLSSIPVEKTWEWIGHTRGVDALKPKTFEHNRGGIIVRAPDQELLRKAVLVAGALGARVIGDDDRIIDSPAVG
jgi:hypothetical protein